MVRFCELKQKEVINIRDGCRLGYICDIVIDIEEGCVVSIIIPGTCRMFGMFGYDQEYCVPWCAIKQIGDDIILVDVETEKILVNCD